MHVPHYDHHHHNHHTHTPHTPHRASLGPRQIKRQGSLDAGSLLDWLEAEVKLRLDKVDEKLDRLLASHATHGSHLQKPAHHHMVVLADATPESSHQNGRESAGGESMTIEALEMESSSHDLGSLNPRVTRVASAPTDKIVDAVTVGSAPTVGWASTARSSCDRNLASVHSVHTTTTDVPEIPYERALTKETVVMENKISLRHTKFVYSTNNKNKINCNRIKREKRIRDDIFAFLDDPESGRMALLFSETFSAFAAFTVLITAIQTVDPPILSGMAAAILETSFDGIFAADLGLRFACCPSQSTFFTNRFNILDMAVTSMFIIRAYAGFNLADSPGFIRTLLLCLAPTLRFMKTLRRFQSLIVIFQAFRSAFEALPMLLWFLLATILIFSTAIYLVEHQSNIDSLPKSMWFVIVTLSTVGYGDVSPSTILSHVFTSLLIIFSALYMAMPLGIMGSAFTDAWINRDRLLLFSQTRKRLHTWGYNADDIPIIFSIFDTDNSGFIELQEFVVMVQEMRIGLSQERIVALFESIDLDDGGAIDDREFVRQVFPDQFLNLYEMVSINVVPDVDEDDGGGRRSIAPARTSRFSTRSSFSPARKSALKRGATLSDLYKRKSNRTSMSEAAADYVQRVSTLRSEWGPVASMDGVRSEHDAPALQLPSATLHVMPRQTSPDDSVQSEVEKVNKISISSDNGYIATTSFQPRPPSKRSVRTPPSKMDGMMECAVLPGFAGD